MSSNANADQWFESYPLTMEMFKQAPPFYRVLRYNGHDYAFAPGVFRHITSEDDYHFLRSAGFIRVPHGEADNIALNLLQYIRDECAKFACPGVVLDEIAN